ncbi:MAG TPA: helix-turn-helix domain-containing protein [Solirubrobacteraceae bacterium]|nr:helix-turn-helix domain-containing protein [Solirubrobacteraceae bacterium]
MSVNESSLAGGLKAELLVKRAGEFVVSAGDRLAQAEGVFGLQRYSAPMPSSAAAPFRDDLLARRMVAAAGLLSDPTIRVRDVARLVGYHQSSYFAHAFRGCYGVSPAAFRAKRRWQGNEGMTIAARHQLRRPRHNQ